MEDIKKLDDDILRLLAHDEDETETNKMLMSAVLADPNTKEIIIQLNSVANKRNRLLLTYISKLSRALAVQSDDYERMEEYMEERSNTTENKLTSKLSPTAYWVIGSVATILGTFLLLFIFTMISPDTTSKAVEHTKDVISLLINGSNHAKSLGTSQTQQNQSEGGVK